MPTTNELYLYIAEFGKAHAVLFALVSIAVIVVEPILVKMVRYTLNVVEKSLGRKSNDDFTVYNSVLDKAMEIISKNYTINARVEISKAGGIPDFRIEVREQIQNSTIAKVFESYKFCKTVADANKIIMNKTPASQQLAPEAHKTYGIYSVDALALTVADITGMFLNIGASLSYLARAIVLLNYKINTDIVNALLKYKLLKMATPENDTSSIVSLLAYHRSKTYTKTILISVVTIVGAYAVSLLLEHPLPSVFYFAILGICILAYAGKIILVYRINHGYFGNNGDEVLQMLDFIVTHPNKNDFFDGDSSKRIRNQQTNNITINETVENEVCTHA